MNGFRPSSAADAGRFHLALDLGAAQRGSHHPAVHRLITERAGKDVLLLVAGQGFPDDLNRQIGKRLLDYPPFLDPLQWDVKARVLAVKVEQLCDGRASSSLERSMVTSSNFSARRVLRSQGRSLRSRPCQKILISASERTRAQLRLRPPALDDRSAAVILAFAFSLLPWVSCGRARPPCSLTLTLPCRVIPDLSAPSQARSMKCLSEVVNQTLPRGMVYRFVRSRFP